MAMEIVDVPINSMVIFHCYVSSPEGIYDYFIGALEHEFYLSIHWE